MLLSITTTHRPASDLGYLLHKHPGKVQSFDLSFGRAHAYYPEVGDDRCTACLLLDVDAVGLVRGRNPDQDFLLAQYVNDRPYVASSFLSVAISQVFGSALNGKCKDRPELVTTPIPLEARLDVLPVRGGEHFLRAVFEPLGYQVEATRAPLDERFPEWGDSPYFSVTLRHTVTLADLLSHLYVLVPVFDAKKHYFIGVDVSVRTLEIAARRLKLERLPDRQAERVKLIHGSLMYRDQRLAGFDAAAVVEVIEHLDPPRLAAFERVVFEFARPGTVVLTTPNKEFNVTWETLPAGTFRHHDHRFEWTRAEFQAWANGVATRFGYAVRFLPVGPEHPEFGPPTQMAVFRRTG